MSLKRNLAFNTALTLSQYIIGFITFPYVSRILGASGIGTISFADNIINYFLLFSTLGISIIGTREIAKFRNDREKLSEVFSSLLAIYILTTFIVAVAYFFVVAYVGKLHQYKELFYIGTAKIIFSAFLIEWYYKGIENFRFIAVRSIAIKLLYVVLLFVMVKEPGDYLIYFALTTGVVIINSIVNFSQVRKLISFSKISFRPYIKPVITLGSYALLTSMYTTFNVIYLGWTNNNTEVGYYWAALTIYGIVLGFFTAYTTVMMPRMTALISEGNIPGFNRLINKSIDTLFFISFPVIITSVILAPYIIRVLSGNGFQGAIVPMQLIMPLVIVVGVAQVLAVQVLMPLKKDRIILNASILGSVTGIILNILLVGKFGSVGTAMVLLISESAITFYYIRVTSREAIFSFPWKSLLKNFLVAMPYAAICIASGYMFQRTYVILPFALVMSALYFIYSSICIIRNEEIIRMWFILFRNFSLKNVR